MLTFNWTAEGSDTSEHEEVAFQTLWPCDVLVALVTSELVQIQMHRAVTLQLAGHHECPAAAL